VRGIFAGGRGSRSRDATRNHEPGPPSAAIIARQKAVAKRARSPLRVWIGSGGWAAIGAPLLLIAASVVVTGPSRTGELLLGVASPATLDHGWVMVGLSWLVGAIGWLGVPAIVGALVGYTVTVKLSSYRSRSYDEIANEPAGDE
jgi:hypothetical protein